MITREWLTQKIEECKRAEAEHLALANANRGAIEAFNAMLAELDKPADISNQEAATLEAE